MLLKAALVHGSFDLLILQVLTLGPYHGLGLSRRVSQVTHGAFDVKPGSLFPALHRMEEHGWLASE
jgi:PadR family transcriptional regulator